MSEVARAVVVEDEPLARQRIEDLVGERGDVELVAAPRTVRAALGAVAEVRPDLVFLDVRLPDGTGFEVLEALPTDPLPLVLFVTAYEQHAVEAFEVHAFDYVLKPFDRERFHGAVDRAVARLRARRRESLDERIDHLRCLLQRSDRHLERLAVRKRDRLVVLDVEEIVLVRAARNYAQLHTVAGVHLVRSTMDALERMLDPRHFARIHRSCIVRLDQVRELHPLPGGDYRVVLRTGESARLSRSYRRAVDTLLGLPGA